METITISKQEYNKLVDASIKLNYLELNGVDNWEWYDEAMRGYWEEKEENNNDNKTTS